MSGEEGCLQMLESLEMFQFGSEVSPRAGTKSNKC